MKAGVRIVAAPHRDRAGPRRAVGRGDGEGEAGAGIGAASPSRAPRSRGAVASSRAEARAADPRAPARHRDAQLHRAGDVAARRAPPRRERSGLSSPLPPPEPRGERGIRRRQVRRVTAGMERGSRKRRSLIPPDANTRSCAPIRGDQLSSYPLRDVFVSSENLKTPCPVVTDPPLSSRGRSRLGWRLFLRHRPCPRPNPSRAFICQGNSAFPTAITTTCRFSSRRK